MGWKLFSRILGIILLLISIIFFLCVYSPLAYWIFPNGTIFTGGTFYISLTISIIFFLLGLIYFFILEEKINKLLKTSLIMTLLIMIINLGYFCFAYLADKFTNTDMIGFGLLYLFWIIPISIITLIVSLICAFISLFKK